ncbi:DeoR/GlpR family DNA-binding transcription regulator [Risungbinella massiliensis]|uniref:DeoR/GlpR family DNA-binding transcription regulator n=1 Tax=Risungbinella massiliensis TaxID=1329796 RepID=UPI0005CBBB3E|nr:DeoR/GlpR family DNA-binding transcription regulator [Risungbinella massiliensis]
MLKEERHRIILELLKQERYLKIAELADRLGVTKMTVRRDLSSLEEEGVLHRVHGGAQRVGEEEIEELSHQEKLTLHMEEKSKIAKRAASLVEENDTVFIGPGTTNELIYSYIRLRRATVVTNSLTVFQRFQGDERFELILMGGRYRERTGSFIGTFANESLRKIKVNKAFIGTNGVYHGMVTTANEEEGLAQQIILDNALAKYILCDESKIGKQALYAFYSLHHVNALISDARPDTITGAQITKYTELLTV